MTNVFKICSILLILITPLTTNAQIIINEIMYNTDGPDVEFVELYNASVSDTNVTDWSILDNNNIHTPCKLVGTIKSGEYFVIAAKISEFNKKYSNVTNINPNDFDTGLNGWGLGNGGDQVRLFDSSDNLVDSVKYEDGGDWPGLPDGNGPSLELLHPFLDNSIPTSWDPSSVKNGTPGQQNSVYTENIQPTCKDGYRSIDLPTNADEVIISVLAFDNEGLTNVELYVNVGSGYVSQQMNDNGLNAVAGDSLYTTTVPAQTSGTLVKYYAIATDNIAQQDKWPNNAPAEYRAYTVDYTPPNLKITEILAVNDSINTDSKGEFDDWIEIQNQDEMTVNLGGMYINNSLKSSRDFELPATSLNPNEYLLIWADNDAEQGNFHASFKLSSSGESVGLFETTDHGNRLIHGWKYGLMSPDVSMGYFSENATAPEYLVTPTPGSSNTTSTLFSPVCINEFQSTSDFGGPDDWIEIYNRSNEPFDLSGCFLSDSRTNNTMWEFPTNTILQAHNFLVIYEDALGFGFSSMGDDVIMLTAADTTTGLDFYDFGIQTADQSEGRFPDGSDGWQFFNNPTKGQPNIANIITEINNNINIPQHFTLYQNYPNPFNSTTTLHYELPARTHVRLVVYDATGKYIKTLINHVEEAGNKSVQWHGDNNKNQPVASGFYIVKIQTNEYKQIKKMLLLK